MTSAGLTDEHVCILLGIGTAAEVLSVERVRFLLQAIRDKVPFLLGVLSRDLWWMPQAAGDVCTLCAGLNMAGFKEVPQTPEEMRVFLDLVIEHHDIIQRTARGFLSKRVKGRSARKAEIIAGAELKTKLRLNKIAECTLKDHHATGTHACHYCGQTFLQAGALGSHLAKVHQQPAETRRLARGSVCQVCMRDFHSTTRLRRHLISVTRCRVVLRNSDVGGDGPVITGADRGWLMPRCVEGPRPFWAQLQPADDEVIAAREEGMKPASIGDRLMRLCPPGDFHMGKAAQLFMTVHRLHRCFENLDPVHDYLEEVPLTSCAANIVMDVLEAYSCVSSQATGTFQGCKWDFAWKSSTVRIAEHGTHLFAEEMS